MTKDFKINLLLPDLEATHNLGKKITKFLQPGTVILLEGDLGTGKTSLVQGIGKGLGIKELIVSPTFTLINEYHEGTLPLYHFDLYRLQSQEVASLNPEIYWEGIEVTPGITAIEWADRLTDKPDQYWEINLTHTDSGRQIMINLVGIEVNFE
jgi:tRNA threonylcarbamoyladenosine biosynthesis protein TsaE